MKQLYFLLIITLLAITSIAQDKKDLKPGQTFKDCKDCPEMVVRPAGNFTIGSPDNEKGRVSKPEDGSVEGPRRHLKISQFAAGKFDLAGAGIRAADRSQ